MAGDITSANASYALAVRGLFDTPQLLQGYSADAAWETEASESAEVMKGVDGKLSAGFTPFLTRQTITLQADSASVLVFEQWLESQKAQNAVFLADGTIAIPSVRRKYALTDGVIMSVIQIPSARKVLQPRAFIITWGDISPAPF